MFSIEQIARVAHETNRAFCQTLGDLSQQEWYLAEEWQRKSAIEGVRFVLDNPSASESAQHDAWLSSKKEDGWKYGKVKDSTKKEHPCFVTYEQLPLEQRMKDYLFKGVVSQFAKHAEVEE